MSDSATSSPAHSFKNESIDEIFVTPDLTVIDGWFKFRDQKRWKLMWGVVTKLSPAADCLHVQLYKDSKDRYKQGMTKASLSLEHFLGIETGFTLDKESNTIAIICRDVTVTLAFESRERLIQWQMKINSHLGESAQFLVQISSAPSKSKLNVGPARLHVQNRSFCVSSGSPPKLIGYWEIKHLRRYGVVDGKFCFEGGSLCNKGEGLFVLLSDECEEISWSMHMASEGRLIPKKRFMSRNMSVIESPSRRYIQRPSDCAFGEINANLQNTNCRSFSNVYEWASIESTTNDTDSDGKISENYAFRSQFANRWMESKLLQNVVAEENEKFVGNEYEQCAVTNTPSTASILEYSRFGRLKLDGDVDRCANSNDDAPERPPKPSKYSAYVGSSNGNDAAARISSSDRVKTNNNSSDSCYDVPKTFCSKIQSKTNNHDCSCIKGDSFRERFVNFKQIDQTTTSDYDIPPAAIPVASTCSCISKMRVIVESEQRHQANSCPCQHAFTCWPYNWLQLAYCRRENAVLDTARGHSNITGEKAETKANNLYATVDMTKKTNRKLLDGSNGCENRKPRVDRLESPRSIGDNSKDGESYVNNSYTNLYFEHSLKYYENARELMKNNGNRVEAAADESRSKCVRQNNESDGDVRKQENYIVMNPICSSKFSQNDGSPPSVLHKSSPSSIRHRWESSKSIEKLPTAGRCRSNSTSSAKSVPATFHFNNRIRNEMVTCCRRDEIVTGDASKTAGNRDSSSSNDSGFSIGSCRLQGSATTSSSADDEITASNSPSTGRKSYAIDANRGGTSQLPTQCSKSVPESSTDVSFQFHSSKRTHSNGDVPVCHKIVGCKKDSMSSQSERTSSIPYIDSQSTSSETSDISDYIETLSLSSHSSSDTACNTKQRHPSATILRPRSGKEYEKANKVLVRYVTNGDDG